MDSKHWAAYDNPSQRYRRSSHLNRTSFFTIPASLLSLNRHPSTIQNDHNFTIFTMNSTDAFHEKLDSVSALMQKLKSTSSPEDFAEFGAFFDPHCTVYLKSMREHAEPSFGREGAVQSMKENLDVVHIEERRVLSRSTSADGFTIVCETKNRLDVLGEILDPFFETAIVSFNDKGLIIEWKMYSCRSHIVALVQIKTGAGPYSKTEMDGLVREHHLEESKEVEGCGCE